MNEKYYFNKKPLCVISIDTFGEYAQHDIQTNSLWTENPYSEGYAVVPEEMVSAIMKTKGYCDLKLNDANTKVVSFTAREIPVKPRNAHSTQTDILSMLVDQEYRLTLLELGV